ncbi:4-hydroxy-tetrahydrodipicolinate reductase [Dokdonia donghaensis]|uniref:4-hydroxy-tetrahydrodipicolinate reductase n=1 Tax=Dokdonia donghaensis DSW-1 TaxID=1300343 RepID=A0A0A2H0T7_9FLAO|nr:4-hydroxy-tetrahydrodipicolinate reductase [Dokdonia donghaensis]ANH61675.1 4-hydroxy-tetrahydrodipicolinate reductase [Dokdonia donghaensis DSW-1]KGO06265.1 dihydrodipicolinate reductase [Dokdonia donghaensis DSW-1]
MKIALLGYGKMGQTIEKIAESRGHEIVARVSSPENFTLENADIAIDFSIPDSAVNHITKCFEAGIPIVSGTTGWLDSYEDMVALCKEKNGGFIYASNFSVGVNLFFEFNKKLAQIMAPHNDYKVDMTEIHHTQKLDAPSGTAITLAEGIIETTPYTAWSLAEGQSIKDNHIPITAEREGTVPGTHIINYKSDIDTIILSHEAHSRQGFAQGAVVAAEWLLGKQGNFSMRDVLGL